LGKYEYDLAMAFTVDFSNVPFFVNSMHMKEFSSPESSASSSLTLHIDKQKKKIPYIVIFS